MTHSQLHQVETRSTPRNRTCLFDVSKANNHTVNHKNTYPRLCHIFLKTRSSLINFTVYTRNEKLFLRNFRFKILIVLLVVKYFLLRETPHRPSGPEFRHSRSGLHWGLWPQSIKGTKADLRFIVILIDDGVCTPHNTSDDGYK